MQGLRLAVAVSFVVSVLSGICSAGLIRQLADGNARRARMDSARSLSIGLYAEGLQMCQATRNILLDPQHPAAWKNFAAAAKV